jgi:hypothetical protein
MANIHFTQTDFDFATLTALTPIPSTGGTHLSKFRVHDSNPFYLQLPKCRTKQGIVKPSGGKKQYCDLVFTHENETFIRWMERLEEYTRKVLFDNRQKWFSTELNEHDIETLFASPLKLYKSGKCYLLRVSVPTVGGACSLKIYDENQDLVSTEEVKEDTQIITVLEIQGIKCASMSFYLEMEVKQMMVVAPVDQSFERGCVIAREPVAPISTSPISASTVSASTVSASTVSASLSANLANTAEVVPAPSSEMPNKIIDVMNTLPAAVEQPDDLYDTPIEVEELDIEEEEGTGAPAPEIQEFDIDLEKTLSTKDVFQIKKRNDLYYEMYREAKRKARLARDLAISTYLEAKRIKTTFLAMDNTESDLEDAEFKNMHK